MLGERYWRRPTVESGSERAPCAKSTSGTAVRRPVGQLRPDASADPIVAPTRSLDYELELGSFLDRCLKGTVFKDDFNDKDGSEWGQFGGTWNAATGGYAVDAGEGYKAFTDNRYSRSHSWRFDGGIDRIEIAGQDASVEEICFTPGWRCVRFEDSFPAASSGEAIYAGMVFASVVHCPTLGGVVASMPTSAPGAIAVVNLGNAVSVVTPTTTWQAVKAARSLSVTWVDAPTTAATRAAASSTRSMSPRSPRPQPGR